jgi:hypothetical protein
MHKLILAGCLAVGLTLGMGGLSTAKADHGFGGYRGVGCHPGFGHVGHHFGPSFGHGVRYGVGYAPYGNFYRAPVVAVPTFVPVGGFGVGRSSFYGGVPRAIGPSFGGGFGNLGFPSSFNTRGFPRTPVRIGF